MKSFVRFCVVSLVLVALAFLCDGLRANFLTEPDARTTTMSSSDSFSTPGHTEHSFVKFNTPCLSSPTAGGHTVIRTVTGASASPFRHARGTDLNFRILALKSFYGVSVLRLSLPTLRKLRL